MNKIGRESSVDERQGCGTAGTGFVKTAEIALLNGSNLVRTAHRL
jgi:hypothetical protein